jgi:hypothetical protein
MIVADTSTWIAYLEGHGARMSYGSIKLCKIAEC